MSTWTPVSQLCACCPGPACQGKFEREAAELKENSAQAMKEQGDTLLRQGNFEGAVNAYDRALDLDGSLTPVLGNRAICKLKLKQYRCGCHCRSNRSCRADQQVMEGSQQQSASGCMAEAQAAVLHCPGRYSPHSAPCQCPSIIWVARAELLQRCMGVKAAAVLLLRSAVVPAATKCCKDRA